ncbi:methyltransferase domain-containing protein [Agrococcus sp. SL85]|uniref:class I SAM-dependent methyltransferase n=1 Tax=Agrococcus sp. SL85 TaxID=2995141 RepID=UPI00226D05F2|nr:methyltransferase domain-containing protein [Agrococcus sp. SL85]WAC66065.1 methyltransferase domain-containing protein [Agrococcus sp. SL85]
MSGRARPRGGIYGWGAAWYDAVSGEPVYRAGREAGIDMLGLREGDAVLDLGCGTGLNLPGLVERVGPTGRVVAVDRSASMLAVARRRVARHGWRSVTLVQADVTALDARALAPAADRAAHGGDSAASAPEERGFDAVIATYAMSVVDDPDAAWRAACAVLRPGARACIVDMQPPTGAARLLSPLARLACAIGGADLAARPWRLLERDAVDVRRRELRGSHIVVVAGSVR